MTQPARNPRNWPKTQPARSLPCDSRSTVSSHLNPRVRSCFIIPSSNSERISPLFRLVDYRAFVPGLLVFWYIVIFGLRLRFWIRLPALFTISHLSLVTRSCIYCYFVPPYPVLSYFPFFLVSCFFAIESHVYLGRDAEVVGRSCGFVAHNALSRARGTCSAASGGGWSEEALLRRVGESVGEGRKARPVRVVAAAGSHEL